MTGSQENHSETWDLKKWWEDGVNNISSCVDDELAQQINFEQAELLQPEEQDFSTFIQARRFPMRPPTTESDAVTSSK